MSELTKNERLTLLQEHSRETCTQMRDHAATRNRLFVYSLVAFGVLALRGADAPTSERLVQSALDKVLAPGTGISSSFLSVLLWFGFMTVTVRYLQAASFVNRQYVYQAQIEAEVSRHYGSDVLARESTAYQRNYPAFASWMDIIYTWIFPIALMVGVVWAIVVELQVQGFTWAGLACLLIAIVCAATVATYVYSSKWESKRRPAQLATQHAAQPTAASVVALVKPNASSK